MSVNYYKNGRLTPIAGASNTDVSNTEITFTESEQRTNIESGEKVNTLFGKIKKWFSDLKKVAFSGKYNDLEDAPKITTSTAVTEEGWVADARALNTSNPDSPLYGINQGLAKLHGYAIYTHLSQLGLVAEEVSDLGEIIDAMSNYSMYFSIISDNVLYQKGLLPAPYGSLEIKKFNGTRVYLTYYNNEQNSNEGLKEWRAYYHVNNGLTAWIYAQDTTNVAYVPGDVITTGTQDVAGFIAGGDNTVLYLTIPLSKSINGAVTTSGVNFSIFTVRNYTGVLGSAGYYINSVAKTSGGLRFAVKKDGGWGTAGQMVAVEVGGTITVS